MVLSVGCDAPNRGGSGSPGSYIECVFETDLVELDAAGTLAAAEANEHALITAEIRRLQIAAHWADLHPGEGVAASGLPGIEHPVRLGGEGTPTIGDFAAAELGCVLRISDGSAARLIGDALDLRHRLRLIWAAAQAGQAPAYQARHIATATRQLTASRPASSTRGSPPHLVRCRGAGCKPCCRRRSTKPIQTAPNKKPLRQPKTGSCGSAAPPSTG